MVREAAGRKQYKRTIPVSPDVTPDQLDELRWYTRESLEHVAAERRLSVIDWAETIVPAKDIPPKTAKYLEYPINHYTWYQFVAIAERFEPEPAPEVCGYCSHPPHASGECGGVPEPWRSPAGTSPADGACLCVGTAALP